MSILSAIGDTAKNLGSDVATGYHVLSTDLGNYFHGGPSASAPAAPRPNYGTGPYSAPTGTNAPDLAAIYNKQLQDALARSQVTVPRMVTMDIGGAWNKANQIAASHVNPVYKQMMSDFLAKQQTDLQRQQQDTTSQESMLDQNLSQTFEDAATARQRATEDNATNVSDINATQAANSRSEGLSYDAARRSMEAGLGASGMAESGLGRGQVAESDMARTAGSNEQVRQSDNKVAAANTLMNRTFQDLSTSTERAQTATTAGKAKLGLNLERFIEDQGTALKSEQQNEDMAKSTDIATQAASAKSQLVDQWLASLPSKGYTAQEVANAASIYR